MKRLIFIVIILAVGFGVFRLFSDSTPEIRNPNPPSNTIICFGDSLTYGTGAAKGKEYPTILSQLINRPVINAGIPGDTTASALTRLNKDVLQKKPGIVVITLGVNDLKNGVPKDGTFTNLTKIITTIQNHGALVVVGGLKSFPIDRGYGSGYREVTEETGSVLVPDILDDIFEDPELMSDRIHPNNKGYAIMAERFAKTLKPYLEGQGK